ncbi:MAG TPA: hypothetical protein VIL72_00035 [Beijerinckiaceae bacterium]
MDTPPAKIRKPLRPGLIVTASGAAGLVLSWAGLLWTVFAAEPAGVESAVARHHLVTIAQCALFTSIALIVIGALRAGFAALDRFFGSILERTQQGGGGGGRPAAAPQPRPTAGVVDAGMVGGRPYRRFANGSVQVDTLLGQRMFASMEEARAFVGEPAPRRAA